MAQCCDLILCVHVCVYSSTFRHVWVWMCQREAGPETHGGNVKPCCPTTGRTGRKHSLLFLSMDPSSPPSHHFPALGLSLLCVWVVIMAGCPSRKVWPRFPWWGGGWWVGWWEYHHGTHPPQSEPLASETRFQTRREQSQGRSLAFLQPVPLQGKTKPLRHS